MSGFVCFSVMCERSLEVNETPTVSILYVNYKGERALRTIVPNRMWFGTTLWHPAEQWFLDAFDVDKQESRTFALADVIEWQVGSSHVPVRQATSREAIGA